MKNKLIFINETAENIEEFDIDEDAAVKLQYVSVISGLSVKKIIKAILLAEALKADFKELNKPSRGEKSE